MATIRVPEQAQSLLVYCRAYSSVKDNKTVFDTYAQFTTFAASMGYYYVEKYGRDLPQLPEFLKNPNPIELDIFINRGLFTPLTSIAIAHTGSTEILSDHDVFCRLIERYATVGFIAQEELLEESGSPNFATSLARLLQEAAEEELGAISDFI